MARGYRKAATVELGGSGRLMLDYPSSGALLCENGDNIVTELAGVRWKFTSPVRKLSFVTVRDQYAHTGYGAGGQSGDLVTEAADYLTTEDGDYLQWDDFGWWLKFTAPKRKFTFTAR